MVLFALFFVGGMAGSTSGGVKALRVLVLLKQTGNEIRKHLHPRAILVTRIGKIPVKEDVIARVVGFVILYLLLCLAGALALGLTGVDPLTAVGASIATVGNVGPAFAELGPTDNYGWMSAPGSERAELPHARGAARDLHRADALPPGTVAVSHVVPLNRVGTRRPSVVGLTMDDPGRGRARVRRPSCRTGDPRRLRARAR